jgi:ribosomal RNA methyltransferase Nop2
LSNFKELRDPEVSRNDYLESLKNDICACFDYNKELVELIFDLFPPANAV